MILAALAMVAAAWIGYRSSTPDRAIEEETIPAWIELPSGEDASDWTTRTTMIRAIGADDLASSEGTGFLAKDCGRPHGQPWRNAYYLTIGDAAFSSQGRLWGIAFLDFGDRLEVHSRQLIRVPPPPPAPDVEADRRWHYFPIRTTWLARAQLESIRQAWRQPSLWRTPQESASCMDGGNAILEACVDGRYAIRDRGCGDPQALNRLWQAVQQKLPNPPAPLILPMPPPERR